MFIGSRCALRLPGATWAEFSLVGFCVSQWGGFADDPADRQRLWLQPRQATVLDDRAAR